MAPSRIRISESDSILGEISSLIAKRKKIEKEFAALRKGLMTKRRGTVLSSENWEEWKILSQEYDEMKKVISEIDEKYLALKRLRRELRRRGKKASPSPFQNVT